MEVNKIAAADHSAVKRIVTRIAILIVMKEAAVIHRDLLLKRWKKPF